MENDGECARVNGNMKEKTVPNSIHFNEFDAAAFGFSVFQYTILICHSSFCSRYLVLRGSANGNCDPVIL